MATKRSLIIARILRKDFLEYTEFGMDKKTIKQNLMHTAEHSGVDMVTAEKVAQWIMDNVKVAS